MANEGDNYIQAFRKNGAGDLDYVKTLPLDKTQSSENSISTLYEDSRGNVWIGSNIGLFIQSANADIRKMSPGLEFVNTICEDKEKNIWVGTEKEGVYIFHPQNQGGKITYTSSRLNLTIDNYQSLSVQSICCTKNGDIYIGTKEGCIYFYNAKEHTATDISGSGCYVEMLSPFPIGTGLGAELWIGAERVTTRALVRTCDPRVGMGIEFVGLKTEDQRRFQDHLQAIDPFNCSIEHQNLSSRRAPS